MKTNHLAALLIATTLTPLSAFAQSAFELDEAVVFSGLIPVEINRTGTTVEVLEDEDLEADALSLQEALDAEPGLTFTSNGGLGATTNLRLRGLDKRYIGVTIDGIEVTDPSSNQGGFDFGTLTRAGVGRVEFAKGAQTAIYGSDAIAGAINITSWRPTKTGLSYGGALEAGSFGTVASTLNFGLLDETTEFAVSLSGTRSDGFSAQASNEEADAFNQVAANLFVARDVSENVTLGFSALYGNGYSEFDGFADPAGVFFEDRRGARAFAQISGDRIDHELAASFYEIDRFDPDSAFTNRFIGERTKIEYLGTSTLGDATLAFGADWTEEKAKLDADAYDGSNGAVFGEVQYALSDAVDLSFGLRHDIYSDFDDQTTGRLALAYRMSEETILRASIASGYRAPSLYERFGPFGSTALQPESSLGGEVGFETSIGETTLVATVYYTEIDDLIGYDFVTASFNQVPGTTVSQGAEIALSTLIGSAEVYGNYTYTDAETDGVRLLRVPRHDLTLGVSAPVTDRLTGALELRHVRDRLDVDDAFATVAAEDYTVANAALTYQVSDQMDAYLRIENLFDEDYQAANGFNTSDRAFYVGLRAEF